MGGDCCTKGREIESQHRILDIYYSHLFLAKIKLIAEETENIQKDAIDG